MICWVQSYQEVWTMFARTLNILRATIRRFRLSKRGNLAIIFAIMSIP